MGRIRIACGALAAAALSGCVMGIPDADPPVPKVEPCRKFVIVQPDNRAYCMTEAEFRRFLKRNMPSDYPAY